MRPLAVVERELAIVCARVRCVDDPQALGRHDALIAELNSIELARAEREIAAQHAALAWRCLPRRNAEGERYLETRRLDAAELASRDVVRFNYAGNPCVALHSFDDGDREPINVVTRVREPGSGPKILGRRGCTTVGTLVGRVAELAADGADMAIVVEGVVDALASVLAFPGCVVLGAHGGGNLPSVAAAAAARVVAVRGRLLLAVDADADQRGPGAGERWGLAAARAAIAAGLVLGHTLDLVDLGGAKDLADAYAAGRRWRL